MGKIEKQMEKQMQKALKPMSKIIKPISKAIKPIQKAIKFITKAVKMITKSIKNIFKLIACSIKLIVNLPKCFIFYWLDMIKYTLFYLPLLILMAMVGLAKEWKPIQTTLDKYLGWPNSTQNQCYRCKDKKQKDLGFFEKLKEMMKAKDEKGDNAFNFFAFLIVCLIGGSFFYTFWFVFVKKKMNPESI